MTVSAITPYTLGASSIPAVIGVDPFDSAYALGARLLDGHEKQTSEAMTHGLDSEAWHASLVEAAGYPVMPAPAGGFVHPDLPWLHVHPDGLVDLPGRLGASASSSGNHGATPTVRHRGEARIAQERAMLSQKPGTAAETAAGVNAPVARIGPLELKLRGVAPSDALRQRDTVQSIVQIHVMGATAGLVSTVHGGFGGIRRDEWKVDADDELFEMIVARCEAFLSLLRRGKLPAPDGSDSTRDAIRERFAHGEKGKAVRATQDVWEHVERGREFAEQEARAKELKEREYQHVQDFMGEAVELVSPYDTLAARWTPTTRTSLDTKALRAAHPGLAGEFDKVTTSRRFEANPA